MAKFFMAATNLLGGTAVIRGRDAEHIRVLRMKPGEDVVICDGEGTDYYCRLVRVADGESEAKVLHTAPSGTEPTVRTIVLAGLPKGERADYLVQKCTETGASEIIFFTCTRCVARPLNMDKKLERWQRIAEEAAKQSGRGLIPTVGFLGDYGAVLDCAVHTDLGLFLYETGERTPIRAAIEAAPEARSAAIITGPDGGFASFEAELAQQVGLWLCSIGPRILRCETAPVVALAALMYGTGNL